MSCYSHPDLSGCEINPRVGRIELRSDARPRGMVTPARRLGAARVCQRHSRRWTVFAAGVSRARYWSRVAHGHALDRIRLTALPAIYFCFSSAAAMIVSSLVLPVDLSLFRASMIGL